MSKYVASSFTTSLRGLSFLRHPLYGNSRTSVGKQRSSLKHSSRGGSSSSSSSSSTRSSVSASAGQHESAMSSSGTKLAGKDPAQISEGEWRTILSPEQFRILRQKGTEYPGTGKYNKFYPKEDEGVFECAGCGAPLYTAKSKFDSGCGWPAFYEGIPGAITWRTDADGSRTEILCAKCGGHLGHVFKNEGFRTPTNERHCVNSVSINFKAEKE